MSDSKKAISPNPGAADWAGPRGDKWSSQLAGNQAMLLPVDEPLVEALVLDAPLRIAEVGCGGGRTARAILGRAPAGSVVHGFDISPTLVDVARGQARPGETGLAFDVADMGTATPDAPYERLASRFGVMFFDHPETAFANLANWLAPGGRFAFAVWGRPADNPWIATARDVIGRIIDLPKLDPEAPGPFRYADAEKFVALLARAGFADVAVNDWRGALPVGGGLAPSEAARFAIAAFSNFGELLASAGDDALSRARESLTELFSNHQRGGAVWMDACVHLVTGTRR